MEENIIAKVTHSVLVTMALLGNILVCLVILKSKAFRSPLYHLVANLAIADLVIVISFTPRHILEGLFHHPQGVVGTILCKTITSDTFTWVGAVVSSITLVVIAYERFAAITSPFINRSNFTMKKMKIVITCCWIIAVIFNIPLFCVRKLNRQRGLCESEWPSVSFALGYNIAWLVIIGFLPFCLMAFFYGKVVANLRNEDIPRRHTSISVLKARNNVTKMLMIVTIVYGVCYIPNLILYVAWYVWDADLMYTINKVLLVLILINSCVNPIIYAAQNRQFRKEMADVLCKCCKDLRNHKMALTPFRDFNQRRETACRNRCLSNVIRSNRVVELSFYIDMAKGYTCGRHANGNNEEENNEKNNSTVSKCKDQ